MPPQLKDKEVSALAADRTEIARKNLAKARAKAAKRRKAKKKREEAEREKRLERIAPAKTGERIPRVWAYKDVSYHTLEGVGVAIAAHYGNTEQLEAIGAWASMLTTGGDTSDS